MSEYPYAAIGINHPALSFIDAFAHTRKSKPRIIKEKNKNLAQFKKEKKERFQRELDHPSERSDLNRWRKLNTRSQWKRIDLMGFYICNYKRVFGREDDYIVKISKREANNQVHCGFYYHGTIVRSFINANQMSMDEFKKYTVYALNECLKYFQKDPEKFKNIFWFAPIYKREKLLEKYRNRKEVTDIKRML